MARTPRPDEPLSIRQLEVFAALVDQRSFTQAARHLGLSQSTVSAHIAELEQRLGLRLVERDRSGVEPTRAGRVLLTPAREALRAERSARMAAAELMGLLRGVLVVGGSTIPAAYLLPGWLSAFRARHPQIELKLRGGDSREVAEAVAQGEADLGVVGGDVSPAGLRRTRVGADELVLIAAPSSRLAGGRPIALKALAGEPIVLREEGSGTRQAMLAALEAAGLGAGLEVALEVGSTEAVKAAVRAGLGVSLVSSLAVADEVASGALAVVPVAGLKIERGFHLLAPEDERMSPAGRAFRDEVLAHARAR